MASDKMILFHFQKLAIRNAAFFALIRTACSKSAAWSRIKRRCYLPSKKMIFPNRMNVRHRNCRKQSICIWMVALCKQDVAGCIFHHASHIHNENMIGNMLYN